MASRILIIDDNISAARQLQEYFKCFGMTTDFASSGKEAITRFNSGKYELLLVDFKLPDMDGHKVVAACRRQDPSIKVVFLTGYYENVTRSKIRTNETCIIIEKPCKPSEILQKVESMLNNDIKAA